MHMSDKIEIVKSYTAITVARDQASKSNEALHTFLKTFIERADPQKAPPPAPKKVAATG
jgi:hypothetical protein